MRRVNNFLFIFIGVVDAFAFLRRVNNFLFIFIDVVDAFAFLRRVNNSCLFSLVLSTRLYSCFCDLNLFFYFFSLFLELDLFIVNIYFVCFAKILKSLKSKEWWEKIFLEGESRRDASTIP